MFRLILIIYCFTNICESRINNKMKNELISKYDEWKKAVKKPKNSKAVFDFFYNNNNWPLFDESVRIAEQNINKRGIFRRNKLKNNDIYKWFKKYPPMTKEGIEAYISCLESQDKKLANKFVKQTWIFQNLESSYSKEFRETYSNYLSDTEDAQRVKNLESQNNTASLLAMRDIVDNSKTKNYINKIINNKVKLNSNEVPSDASERYDYIEELTNNKQYKEAANVLSHYNNDEDKLSLYKKYYERRRYIAYYMLRSGEPQIAYEVANKCLFRKKVKNEEKARIQWLLGFISYRFINKPNFAKEHFEQAYDNSVNAVRISKNAFWLGEVYLSQNDVVLAIDWYKKASQYFYTFYGFLADNRLQEISGQYMSPIGLSLNSTTTPQIPADIEQKFRSRELVKVLEATKNYDNNSKYRKYCYDKLVEEIEDPYEEILLIDFAQSNEELETVISKINKKQHYLQNKKSYKKLNKKAIKQIKNINNNKCFVSMVHSIIRQESAFNEKAKSSAGALGLMQLMPNTAKDEANKLNIRIKNSDLYKPSINLTLGSNHLDGLIQKYNNDFVEVLYAYNAGPGNLNKYKESIKNLNGLTILETIELIPIKETRVYIKNVLRNRFYYDKVFKCKSNEQIIKSILNYNR